MVWWILAALLVVLALIAHLNREQQYLDAANPYLHPERAADVLPEDMAAHCPLPVGAQPQLKGGYIICKRLMDLIFSFPAMLLALTISAALGTGFLNTVIAIGVVYLPIFARTARGSVLQIREMEYVEAARCIGCTDARIIFRQILPNAVAPLIVQVSLGLSWAILTESSRQKHSNNPPS